jgi:hypothetical protein
VENFYEYGNEPSGLIKCLESIKVLSGYTSGGFLGSAQLHRVSFQIIVISSENSCTVFACIALL